jgi:hypothetical protein
MERVRTRTYLKLSLLVNFLIVLVILYRPSPEDVTPDSTWGRAYGLINPRVLTEGHEGQGVMVGSPRKCGMCESNVGLCEEVG